MPQDSFSALGPWADYAQNGLSPETARANMRVILEYFIQSGWGGAYLGIFKKIIKPYLDDVPTLQHVLASPVIQKSGDVERGQHGEMIFYDLFKYLMNVDSEEVRKYLQTSFPGFAERLALEPFRISE
jgi:hypothetical protein